MSGETLRIRKKVTQGNLLFGEYTLMKVLAQGPVSLVCEAEHNSLKRLCALKMVHPTYAEREGFPLALIDAFLREARIMASIDHPHVVPVYHAGTVGQSPFIAMRLIPGGTLHARLERSGTISLDWALHLLREAADGLRAVHAAGFLHGSISPEHLLLESQGTARLAGFDHAAPLPLERMQRPPESTPFHAPEMLAGRPLGTRTDLWALGATVAAALGVSATDLRPGLASEQLAIHMMHASPMAGRSPQMAGLSAMLAHLLGEDPASRYPSAEELIDDCRRLSAGEEPIHALGKARVHKDHFAGWKPGAGDQDPFPA